ncbi:MAG: hypothetical protein JXB14_02050 [Candidatus Altiarchaeota archaeon]|nr:hypothetical protein [Candidatus Altiarchaeota archaeon]
MEMKIFIMHKDFTAEAELDTSKTAKAIAEKLPIDGEAEVWKEEVYFEIPLKLPYENQTDKVSEGDICYWPPGNAFCIFFGKSQPVNAVSIIGKVVSGLERFKEVEEGDDIVLEEG